MSLIHIRLKNHDEAKVCIAKAIDIGNHDISELLNPGSRAMKISSGRVFKDEVSHEPFFPL